MEYLKTHQNEEVKIHEELKDKKVILHNETAEHWTNFKEHLGEKFHDVTCQAGIHKNDVEDHLNIFGHNIDNLVKEMKTCPKCLSG